MYSSAPFYNAQRKNSMDRDYINTPRETQDIALWINIKPQNIILAQNFIYNVAL